MSDSGLVNTSDDPKFIDQQIREECRSNITLQQRSLVETVDDWYPSIWVKEPDDVELDSPVYVTLEWVPSQGEADSFRTVFCDEQGNQYSKAYVLVSLLPAFPLWDQELDQPTTRWGGGEWRRR